MSIFPTTVSPRAATRSSVDTDMEPIREAEIQTLRESLSYLISHIARNMIGCTEKRVAPFGISNSQWRFLRALYMEDGMTQRELSNRISLREPTTVRALTRLERDGLIHRVTNEIDKRKVNVFLTSKGRRLVSEVVPFIAEVNDLSLAGFTQDEEQMLKRLLIKAVHNLDADLIEDR